LGFFAKVRASAGKVLGHLGVEIGKVRQTIESVLGRNERHHDPADHPDRAGQEGRRDLLRGGPPDGATTTSAPSTYCSAS